MYDSNNLDLFNENIKRFLTGNDPQGEQLTTNKIFDPHKNFIRTLFRAGKSVLDSELNESGDISNLVRRSIYMLLSGEACIVRGFHLKRRSIPEDGLAPVPSFIPMDNQMLIEMGNVIFRGYELTIEKNCGGFPSVNQNFKVITEDETVYPNNPMGFSPNATADYHIGDHVTYINHTNTFYDSQKKVLNIEIENTCSVGPKLYKIATIDNFYVVEVSVPPGEKRIVSIEENLDNIIKFPPPPGTSEGMRYDFVYIDLFVKELSSADTYVQQNGHLSHPNRVPSNILEVTWPDGETHRRTQVQFDIKTAPNMPPIAAQDHYIVPMFKVPRHPDQTLIDIEEVVHLIPRFDLEFTGLMDVVQKSGNIKNQFVSVLASGIETPIVIPIGTTLTWLNKDNTAPHRLRVKAIPINDGTTQYFVDDTESFPEPDDPAVVGFWDFFEARLNSPEDSFSHTFTNIGEYIYLDYKGDAAPVQYIVKVESCCGTTGEGSSLDIDKIKNTIGQDYFGSKPVKCVYPSVDERLYSSLRDICETSIALSEIKNKVHETSRIKADSFITLDGIDERSRSAVQQGGYWDAIENQIVF